MKYKTVYGVLCAMYVLLRCARAFLCVRITAMSFIWIPFYVTNNESNSTRQYFMWNVFRFLFTLRPFVFHLIHLRSYVSLCVPMCPFVPLGMLTLLSRSVLYWVEVTQTTSFFGGTSYVPFVFHWCSYMFQFMFLLGGESDTLEL